MGRSHQAKLATGIYSFRDVARSSPTSSAAYKLAKSVGSYNAWREKPENRRGLLDMSLLHFIDLELNGVQFGAVKLRKSVFERVSLIGAEFGGANLNDATFKDCDIQKSNFKQARLAGADLSGENLNGCNLYETIRDRWNIERVQCESCWITSDRESQPSNPDYFESGEFEIAHGGHRFKVFFPGGMQPIDMLALPFHVNRLLERCDAEQLIFTGMSSVGVAGIEFRVQRADRELEHRVQEEFSDIAPEVREKLIKSLERLIDRQDSLITQQQELLFRKSGARATQTEQAQLVHISESIFFTGDQIGMSGDTFNNFGSAGFVGRAEVGGTFQQKWNEQKSSVDLAELADELAQLREVLRARKGEIRQIDEIIGRVSEAERLAREKNGPGVLQVLSEVGKGVLGVARDIGVTVAVSLIEDVLRSS